MWLAVLGPLLVHDGEEPVDMPPGRLRVLLAALIVRAGDPVAADELAEVVWDGSPPPGAAVTLRSHMARLRRVLGPRAGARLTTRYPGYLLQAAQEEVDALRFRGLCRDGGTALREGAWDRADRLLDDALGLWRGEPLADVPSEALRRDECPGLEALRLQAEEWRADAALHLGRHAEVAPGLESLAARHPLREGFHTQLMLALYRCGRQAEALAAYHRARDILVTELGVEPGPGLRELHQRILSADPALDLTGSPPIAAAGILPAVPQVRYGLPADTVAFTGRGGEVNQITAAIKDAASAGGVVAIRAIDGMPGVGKTALAVHAAHLLRQEFPDRQLFINLHAHTPGNDPVRPEDVLAGLLAGAGVDPRYLPADLEGRAAMWRDRMAGQRALLVLDNAASSAQVVPLLPGDGGCLVLVTSRRHLGDLPGAVTPVLVDVLPPREAADMFTRLAPAAAADREGVSEVTGLAGFLPLAICLLARVLARHPSWTLADLAGETRARLLTLTAENSSVAAAFEVSYRHLDPGSQRFFRLLAVHPGTTTDAYAAAALVGASADQAAGQLEVLHGEGLMTETGYRRYGMHDLIRRYARDLVATETTGDSEHALGRLLDYYQHTAALAGKRLARQTRPGASPPAQAGIDVPGLEDVRRALAWVRAERASLLACLELAARTGQHARVVAHTAGLAAALRFDGPWAEAITRHAAAVDAARHLGDRLGEANALTDLGDVRRRTGDFPGGARAFEEALAIYRELGDRLGEANALFYLGFVRTLTGDSADAAGVFGEALGIYRELGDRLGEANARRQMVIGSPGATVIAEEALSIYRDLGDLIGVTETLTSLGVLRYRAGDYPGAARVLEESLGILRDLDLSGRLGDAYAIYNLGVVRTLTGDYPGAARALKQALGIWRNLGDRLGVATTASALAHVRRLTGDFRGAAGLLQEATGIYRSLGGRLSEAHALRNLAIAQTLAGDHPGAVTGLEQALSIYRDLGDRLDEADAMLHLGTVRSATGDHPSAATVFDQALGIYCDLGNRGGEAETLNEQGTLHWIRGDHSRAQGLHQQALDLARVISSPRDEACALAGLGRCALAAGRTAQAADLLSRAHEIFQRNGAAETRSILAEIDALQRARPG